MTIERSHTACAPYPTIYIIQNKNVHIFVLDGVLCDMGHMHCGIHENYLFIISPGLAWCHHAPGLYLASNGHGRLPNKFEGNPTTLIFFSRGREEGGSEASCSVAPPLPPGDGPGGSQHQATKYAVVKLFRFSTDSKQIWCAYWVIM